MSFGAGGSGKKFITSVRHFLRGRRRAKLQRTSREAGGYHRDRDEGGRKALIGGGNAIDAWEWEGSAVSPVAHLMSSIGGWWWGGVVSIPEGDADAIPDGPIWRDGTGLELTSCSLALVCPY